MPREKVTRLTVRSIMPGLSNADLMVKHLIPAGIGHPVSLFRVMGKIREAKFSQIDESVEFKGDFAAFNLLTQKMVDATSAAFPRKVEQAIAGWYEKAGFDRPLEVAFTVTAVCSQGWDKSPKDAKMEFGFYPLREARSADELAAIAADLPEFYNALKPDHGKHKEKPAPAGPFAEQLADQKRLNGGDPPAPPPTKDQVTEAGTMAARMAAGHSKLARETLRVPANKKA